MKRGRAFLCVCNEEEYGRMRKMTELSGGGVVMEIGL